MKEIKAYIQKRKLSQVTLALQKIEGLSGMSVTKGQGFGRGRAKGMPHRIVDDLVEYVPHVKIDCYAMYTNNPPSGAFRGFGVTQSAFAVESNAVRRTQSGVGRRAAVAAESLASRSCHGRDDPRRGVDPSRHGRYRCARARYSCGRGAERRADRHRPLR